MAGTEITDDDVQLILTPGHMCESPIDVVQLNGCRRITDRTIYFLLDERFSSLRLLCMNGTNTTRDALQSYSHDLSDASTPWIENLEWHIRRGRKLWKAARERNGQTNMVNPTDFEVNEARRIGRIVPQTPAGEASCT